jgi:hypothetical protein
MIAVAFGASAITRRIEWRGIAYELISSERSVVISHPRLLGQEWLTNNLKPNLTKWDNQRQALATIVVTSINTAVNRVREGGQPWI